MIAEQICEGDSHTDDAVIGQRGDSWVVRTLLVLIAVECGFGDVVEFVGTQKSPTRRFDIAFFYGRVAFEYGCFEHLSIEGNTPIKEGKVQPGDSTLPSFMGVLPSMERCSKHPYSIQSPVMVPMVSISWFLPR